MIPFLKRKEEASVSAPANVIKREPDEESDFDPLEAAAKELGDALAAKDFKGAAMALRAAFQLADAEPHMEGEHIG